MSTATKTLAARLCEATQKIGAVEKTGKNLHLRYEYRTEDDIIAAVRPALAECGIAAFISTETVRIEEGLFIVEMLCKLVNTDDASDFETIRGFGAGKATDKNGVDDTGLKKAQTGATRYLWQKLMLLTSGEDDEADNGAPHGGGAQRYASTPAPSKPQPRAAQRPQAVPHDAGDAWEPPTPDSLLPELRRLRDGVRALGYEPPNIGTAAQLKQYNASKIADLIEEAKELLASVQPRAATT